ncbi:putative transaldolase [Cyanobium sp.]|nr:putative transaldolase [Cyanobium sp.]
MPRLRVTHLRLLLDSADPAAWAEWLPSGLFLGVTTNPTLLLRAARPCRLDELERLTREVLDRGMQEIHLQAWGGDAEALAACGAGLAALAPGRVLVKLPITRAGAEAARRLIHAEVPVTFTACYAVPQVLVAAALGARYIAPYLGRIGDLGRDGHADLIAMQQALDGVGATTRLLVASLRDPTDLTRLAAAGVGCFTLAPPVAAALFAAAPTVEAAAQFERDAVAAGAGVGNADRGQTG